MYKAGYGTKKQQHELNWRREKVMSDANRACASFAPQDTECSDLTSDNLYFKPLQSIYFKVDIFNLLTLISI